MHKNIEMKKVSIITILYYLQFWFTIEYCGKVVLSSPLRGFHGAPIIEPFDFVIIDVNTDREIECKAKKPVTWILESHHENINVREIILDNLQEDENIYKSYMSISSASVENVGRYFCAFNESIDIHAEMEHEELAINYEASSIYVFVNDPENLLYNPKESLILGKQYEPFLIPCKPTSPQVKVQLLNQDGEAHYVGTYDSRIGFTVSFSNVEDSGFFDCHLQDDPDKFIQFHVLINEQPLSAYIEKPFIISNSNFFAMNGATFSFTCNVEMDTHIPYSVVFTLPDGSIAKNNSYLEVSNIVHELDNRKKAHLNLTVFDGDRERDEGNYKCIIMDMYNNTNSQDAKITFVDNPYVEFEPHNREIKTNDRKKTARFLIDFIAYPKAKFVWLNPRNEIISNENDVLNRTKYDVKLSDNHVELIVKHPTLDDFGNYVLKAIINEEEFTQTVSLVVSEKPLCAINDVYVQNEEEVHMMCECKAFPPAVISWSFMPCNDLSLWPDCRVNKNLDNESENEQVESKQATNYTQVSSIRFIPSEPGTVKCKARNSLGSTYTNGLVQISDLIEPFTIINLSDEQIANGDLVQLECGVNVYHFTNDIKWLKNGEQIIENDRVKIVDRNTKFSWRKLLIIDGVINNDEGIYLCEAKDANQEIQQKDFNMKVNDAHAPIITSNFNQSQIIKPFGETLILECLFSGLPSPSIKWFKNDEILKLDEIDSRVTLSNGNKTLGFSVLTSEDSGSYDCIVENRIAADRRSIEIIVKTPGQVNKSIMIGVISIILLLVFLSLYLCCKVKRKKMQIAELKAAGLANFEEGNIESINPELNLDEQADLLPYDKKFEFPREKLKLGKQLGAGAFGVVIKAVAENILHYEDESIVAVKMVKKQTDNEVMKALVSELKILIHLGQHLNVVNLLGAVTKNIAKRELMVIVEYCRFGNIQSFLVKHRPYFIDQIRNDRIDPMIMKNEMRWSKNSTYNYGSDENQYSSQPNNNGPMSVTNPIAHMNKQGYVRHSGFQQIDSCNTEATILSSMEHGEDSVMISNNSDQPLWRSNYGMDYKGPARSVCTSDLICWSFQVARGMDYLASKRILHGDLAARNVLLCDDNIVKICDFGLARSLYKTENYKKQGEAPLPFKWLSIEAISDHVFSTYSDVWAFGVVLWEFFSLSKVPYTGMEANQELFYKLRDGYRMEKPMYATQDLYDIMLSCWNSQPESRPLFNELERKLSSFLMESVKDHYLDLNQPYLAANINNTNEKGTKDYLTSLYIPCEDAPSPPIAQEENFYINNSASELNKTGYIAMSPQKGTVAYRSDSPTTRKNLDTSPKQKKNISNKSKELPEEIPMLLHLHNRNGLPKNSDSESEIVNDHFIDDSNSKNFLNGDGSEYKNIFDKNDNSYVNVSNATINNPSYTSTNFDKSNKRH